jgi:LCP family protein required for cell wall assembly
MRVVTTLSVVVLASAGIGHAVITSLDSGIARVDPFKDMKNRPEAGHGMNILLVGADGRDKITAQERRKYRLGGAPCHCTDTIMIVHISEDRERASIVSLPRDSYAETPAHVDETTGKQHSPHPVKLNAAYAEGGPQLTVRTVESMTHVKIDHYLEVDFISFMKTVDVIGGVNICAAAEGHVHRPRPGGGIAHAERRAGTAVRTLPACRRGLRPGPDAAPAALPGGTDRAGHLLRGAAEPDEVR